MPSSLTATPIIPSTRTATAVSAVAGTFPGADVYPGSDVFPGKGTSMDASAAAPTVLTAVAA